MKPTLSPEEEFTLVRKLVYVKWLWLKGLQDSEHTDELSHMSAILNFHNSIEMLIQNIIISYDYATQPSNSRTSSNALKSKTFSALIELVEKQGTDSIVKPLQDKLSILKLAEQRNSIMHHGQQLHQNEVIDARILARRFLEKNIRDFFEIDFDSISMSLLIKSNEVKKWLESAQASSAAGNYQDGVIYASAVVALAEKVVNEAYASQVTDVSPFFLGFRHIDNASIQFDQLTLPSPYNSLNQHIATYVKSSSEKLRTRVNKSIEGLGKEIHQTEVRLNLQMKELTGTSWLLICNADLEKARKFFGLGITVKFPQRFWGIKDIDVYQHSCAPEEYTEESVKISVEFAIDLALKLQALGLSENMYVNSPEQKKRNFGSGPPRSLDLPPLLLEIRKKAESDFQETLINLGNVDKNEQN